jgi:nucleosome binding factor SPN SPT16 subunit
VENLKKSGKVTSYFFAKVIQEVELVIDSGKAARHCDLSKKVLDLMENESELKKCAIKLSSHKVSKDFIDLGAPCSIQSGGAYSSKLFVESNEKELRSDCIVIGMGSLYRSYNTFISRTLLIDPTEEQKSIYKKIETLSRILTQNLRAGVKISDVYKKARMFMQDSLKSIEVPKNFGYGVRQRVGRWESSCTRAT